jgi:hypothetical protein
MTAATASRTDKTRHPFVAADRPPEDRYPVDLPRLLRFQGRLSTLVGELGSIPRESVGTPLLSLELRNLLDEAEGVVPTEMLDELHRFTSLSLTHGETERDLRIAITALQAWIEGLVAQCGMVVTPTWPES